MSAVHVNSIPFSVTQDDSRTPIEGSMVPTSRGSSYNPRLTFVERYSYATARPLLPRVAEAALPLLRGEAHVWPFTNTSLASHTGISPERGYGVLMKTTGGPFSDGHFAAFKASSTNRFKCLHPRGVSDDYFKFTVLMTVRISGTWVKMAFDSIGADRVVDGVVSVGAGWPAFFGVAVSNDVNINHRITLTGFNLAGSAAILEVAELVVLQYEAPVEWQKLWTQRTTRWPEAPLAELGGTEHPTPLSVYIDVTEYDTVSGLIDGVQYDDLVSLRFDCYEQP